MANSKYLTAPLSSTKMPKSIAAILTNEAAERFAFYGLVAVQTVFMVHHLRAPSGEFANLSEEKAMEWVHLFKSVVYFMPILGALIGDIFWGKFKTIILFSVVYCFGFLALIIDQTYIGVAIGFGLVAVGTGIIKPCISANVGDQFGKSNGHLMSKVFGWFYFSINFGSFVAMLLTPWLLDYFGKRFGGRVGVQVAFGVPGIFMIIAFLAYWFGRKKLVHIPAGGREFIEETFSAEGLKAVLKLFCCVYIFVAIFWALFDQTTSKWVLQAENMDLNLLGINVLPAQLQAVNPLLVMAMIPLFAYVIYPAMGKLFKVTPLRKIAMGFFLAAAAFSVSACIETKITAGLKPNIIWQILAYVLITAAEILISITVLEFSYTQAPKKMKSFISSISLLSISIGNLFVWAVNRFIQNDDGTSKLEGASYYWFFVAAVIVAGILFSIVAFFFKEKTYIQDEAPTEVVAE